METSGMMPTSRRGNAKLEACETEVVFASVVDIVHLFSI